MVERHRQHVEPDKQHNEHVELFVRHDLEDDGLRPPLNQFRKTQKNQIQKSITRCILSCAL